MSSKRKTRKGRKKQAIEVAEEYLAKREELDGEGTFLARKKAVTRFVEFINSQGITLRRVRKETIKDFFTHMRKEDGVSINTAHHQIHMLVPFFRWAYENKKGNNPAAIFTSDLKSELPKKSKKLPKPPTQEQMEKIIAAGPPVEKTVIRLLYESGMRLGELVSLKVSDLDLKSKTLKIFQNKQQNERITQLTSECVTLLAAYINHHRPDPEEGYEDILFTSPVTGKALTKRTVERWVKKVSTWVEVPITPHQIRAAMATHMLENGADIREVQMIGGWQNLATLQHYAAVSRSRQKKVWSQTHPLAKEEALKQLETQEGILKDNTELLERMQTLLQQMMKVSGSED